MKRLIAFVLLLCFTAMTFSKAFTYAYFYANREDITQRFCVNKARPGMHCNGKCYLTKIVKEQDKQAAEDMLVQLSKTEVFFVPAGHEQTPAPHFIELKNVFGQPIMLPIRTGFPGHLFRPPLRSFA